MHSGDEWVRKERPQSVKLASMASSWRTQPATQKQLDVIEKWHVPVPGALGSW